MKTRRISLILAVILVCMSIFTACGSKEEAKTDTEIEAIKEEETTTEATTEAEETNEAEAASDDKIVIGYCFSNVSQDNASSAYFTAAEAYAEEQGFELLSMDAKGDTTIQVNQIEDMMKQDIDVMLVWPINGTAVVPALKKAYEAGVKVIISNSRADKEADPYIVGFAGDDYIAQGYDSGQLMAKYAEESGKDTFKVVEVAHIPGYQVSNERAQGFREGIEGSKVELLESQTADGNREKAQQLTENYLLKYPDLDGIWIQGDNMAIGVMNAIEAAGKTGEIIVIGNSLSGESYDRMVAGAYHASCYQDQGEEARWALSVGLKVAKGEEVDFDNLYICPAITPENLKDYERPVW